MYKRGTVSSVSFFIDRRYFFLKRKSLSYMTRRILLFFASESQIAILIRIRFYYSQEKDMTLSELIAQKTGLKLSIVDTIIELLDEGNTVPFIARYRKELTEGASDEQLRDFHDIYTYTKNLEARKLDIIRLIDEKGLLSDELRMQILAATTLAKLEDIYRPYKEKKMSKASIAKGK